MILHEIHVQKCTVKLGKEVIKLIIEYLSGKMKFWCIIKIYKKYFNNDDKFNRQPKLIYILSTSEFKHLNNHF